MDFESGATTLPRNVSLPATPTDADIVNQLDVSVAIGQRFDTPDGAGGTTDVMACVVFAADRMAQLGPTALPVRDSIGMVTIDVTPGPAIALGAEYVQPSVNTVDWVGLGFGYQNNWGPQYVPDVTIDGRGRGTIVYASRPPAGGFGVICNRAAINIRRFELNTSVTYRPINGLALAGGTPAPTEYVLDTTGWTSSMAHAPFVECATDGRVIVRWQSHNSGVQTCANASHPRIATFVPYLTHGLEYVTDVPLSGVTSERQ